MSPVVGVDMAGVAAGVRGSARDAASDCRACSAWMRVACSSGLSVCGTSRVSMPPHEPSTSVDTASLNERCGIGRFGNDLTLAMEIGAESEPAAHAGIVGMASMTIGRRNVRIMGARLIVDVLVFMRLFRLDGASERADLPVHIGFADLDGIVAVDLLHDGDVPPCVANLRGTEHDHIPVVGGLSSTQ